jgi:hypothetical protein
VNIDWAALAIVAVVTIVAASVIVTLFSFGIKLFAVPPSHIAVSDAASPRDDETDDVSDPTRPAGATIGGIAFFALTGIGILWGVYLIIPALHG